MIIKIPETWTQKKPFIFYSVSIWHDIKTLADFTEIFDTAGDAFSYLKNQISFDHVQAATIREDIIYKRTKNAELSTSSPLLYYDKETGTRL